ncbi:unnamed protein product [Leuciscus chuanchicus]
MDLLAPERAKARLSVNGPREEFATYVEWVLVYNGLDPIVSPEDTSPTPNPESSQTPPCEMDKTPEPTADGEQAPEGVTEYMSDQVCEPATLSIAVGVLVEIEGMELSPAYNPATVLEMIIP